MKDYSQSAKKMASNISSQSQYAAARWSSAVASGLGAAYDQASAQARAAQAANMDPKARMDANFDFMKSLKGKFKAQ